MQAKALHFRLLQGFRRIQLRLLAVGLLALPASASLSPYKYFILDPQFAQESASVMSLGDRTVITAGSTRLNLGRFELGDIPALDLAQGTVIEGTGPFTVGSSHGGVDLPLPPQFMGNLFVIPHDQGVHHYYLLSPDRDAVAQIALGDEVSRVNLKAGEVYHFAAGDDNQLSGVIRADAPILVSHRGDKGSVFPVPSAALDAYGVRSKRVYVGAGQDNTEVTVIADDGVQQHFYLNAGDRRAVTVGSPDHQGRGAALRIVADKPIGAIQSADGDGEEATSFWSAALHGFIHALPVAAEYAAVVCATATEVTLYQAGQAAQTQLCNADGPRPGKAYFVGLSAGDYLQAKAPVYVTYEARGSDQGHNLAGHAERYFVLNPQQADATALVHSLKLGNHIRVGGSPLTLEHGKLGHIAGDDLPPGQVIEAPWPFAVSSQARASNLPVAERFLGTEFVVPHVRDIHVYYLYSPYAPAQATITRGAQVDTIELPQGTVVGYNAGADNDFAGVIRASHAIAVAHVASDGSQPRDAYPVVPASPLLWGSHRDTVVVGALNDGTKLTVTTQGGVQTRYHLDAGQQQILLGNSIESQGAGHALRIMANQPIAAVQILSSQPSGASAFWPQDYLRTHYGIPVAADRLMVVCSQAGTQVTLDTGSQVQHACGGDDTYPSQLTFTNLPAHAELSSSQPVYVVYEPASTGEPHQLLGTTQMLAATSPSSESPATVTANQGSSVISTASNGGTIRGGRVVWDLSNSPYILNKNIIVKSGATLVVQAGVELKFKPGITLEIASGGRLSLNGTAAQPVLLTSSEQRPSSGNWGGIKVQSGAGDVSIKHARVEYAQEGLYLDSGIAGDVAVSNSIFQRNTRGMYIDGESSVSVRDTIIRENVQYGVHRYFYDDQRKTAPRHPSFTGGQIYDNGGNKKGREFHAQIYTARAPLGVIPARNIWWGTTDGGEIESGIYHRADAAVDYTPYLDGPDGAPVTINVLPVIVDSDLVISAGSGQLAGRIFVRAGATLTIEAGASVGFFQGGGIIVEAGGTLIIKGTRGDPVSLYGRNAIDGSMNAWNGIEVRQGGTARIDWVEISHAAVGVAFKGGGGSLTNSSLFKNQTGVLVSGNTAPRIRNNTFQSNGIGVKIVGPNARPVITGNNFYPGAGRYAVYISGYSGRNPKIDLQGNWWGTQNPKQIAARVYDWQKVGDYRNPLTSPTSTPALANLQVSEAYISPNEDGLKDSSVITARVRGLTATASWSIEILNARNISVRRFTGMGAPIAATWDGKNTRGRQVVDGLYQAKLVVNVDGRKQLTGLQLIHIDTTVPQAAIRTPARGTSVATVKQVIWGNVRDAHFQNYQLRYEYLDDAKSADTKGVINYSTTQPIGRNVSLGTWVTATQNLILPLGNYALTLRVTDKAGNTAIVKNKVALNRAYISGVAANKQFWRPLAGEKLRVSFDIPTPGQVTLQIYNEQDDTNATLLREISQHFGTPGRKSLVWDGLDAEGKHLPDDNYKYTISIKRGGQTYIYDPPRPGGWGVPLNFSMKRFNIFTNDYPKLNFRIGGKKTDRYRLDINLPSGNGLLRAGTFAPGDYRDRNLIVWNGRQRDGRLFSGRGTFTTDVLTAVRKNSVTIEGNTPTLTGNQPAPNIEIKSDPYIVVHSYDQISNIVYRLNMDSRVSFKILPPKVVNPRSPEAITVFSNRLQRARNSRTDQPLDHQVQWRGYDMTDTNNIQVSKDGFYSFSIEATAVATGVSTHYLGVLRLVK